MKQSLMAVGGLMFVLLAAATMAQAPGFNRWVRCGRSCWVLLRPPPT